jgi:hypothetical protein
MSSRCFGLGPVRYRRRKPEPEIRMAVPDCSRKPAAGHSTWHAFVDQLVDQCCTAGPTRGSRPHHNVTPLTGPFSWKSDAGGDVSGPQAGNSGNRRPDTHSHGLQGTPSSSPETCARARYVSERVVSVYLSRGTHDTQHLSSCLVTPASNVQRFPGGLSGCR